MNCFGDEHLESCAGCRRVVDGLRRLGEVPMRRPVRWRALALAACAGAAAILFWIPEMPESPQPPQPPQPPPLARSAGSIRGKVLLAGAAPRPKKIRTDADPFCSAKSLFAEDVVAVEREGELRLAGAVAWVAAAPPDPSPPPREPVLLRQIECRYAPHVLALRVGQPLLIRNEDPTMHNVHSISVVNREFNFAQARAGAEEVRTFERPEMAIRIKCDIHAWMNAVLFVFDHPFFAVTGEDGLFEIRGVPDGEHELTLWHEKFGERSARAVVRGGAASLEIVFGE
jgi:hypothetical protein